MQDILLKILQILFILVILRPVNITLSEAWKF